MPGSDIQYSRTLLWNLFVHLTLMDSPKIATLAVLVFIVAYFQRGLNKTRSSSFLLKIRLFTNPTLRMFGTTTLMSGNTFGFKSLPHANACNTQTYAHKNSKSIKKNLVQQ